MQLPDEVWELPTKHIGRRVRIYNSLPSTNDLAAELPNGDGTVILAREQTAGRGQYGRSWNSAAGHGVWSSTVLDPPAELRRPVILTGWAAISVCGALRTLGAIEPTIKWPNDVLVAGKKICGVLIEQRCHTIVGIGVNVNHSPEDFAAAGLPEATSLAILLGRSFAIDLVARQLIESLDHEYGELLRGNWAALHTRWRTSLGLIGKDVRAELHGDRVVSGRMHEMTFSHLLLTASDGSLITLQPETVRQITIAPPTKSA